MINGWWGGALILWSIMAVWIIAVLIYSKQTADIDIREIQLQLIDKKYYVEVSITGYIRTRHEDALEKLILCLLGGNFSSKNDASCFTEGETDGHPRRFLAVYELPEDALLEGRKCQQKGAAIDIAQICAVMYSGTWQSTAFRIPETLNDGESWQMKLRNKLCGKSRKIKDIGIDKEQFHDLIKKAAQPVKKQPPEKAQS